MPFFGLEPKYPSREAAETYVRKQDGRWVMWEEAGWWRLSQKNPPREVAIFWVWVDHRLFEFTNKA